jgi:hypothetical protein
MTGIIEWTEDAYCAARPDLKMPLADQLAEVLINDHSRKINRLQ